jgi:RNA 2',3'-cyclic 3'-phosphodiesterase
MKSQPAVPPARLFFALWPDEGVRAQLARWSHELHGVCGGRQTRAENLHVTLAFLGSVEEARVADVERAADTAGLRACTLILDRAGYWKHNRIAWAGVSVVPPGLEALVSELRGALAKSQIRFDAKSFVSHVTLLRDAREPLTMPALVPIEWPLDGFALVQSVTRPQGSRYEIRRSWKGSSHRAA